MRGVDDLSTNDVKAFVAQHYPAHSAARIEWIDDSSVNIVFDTPQIAQEALAALIGTSMGLLNTAVQPVIELVNAKPFQDRPGIQLQVRTAMSSDIKKPRAHEASRFYMMHPEHDPREKRRSERFRQGYGEYRARKYSRGEDRRRRQKDQQQNYDSSMYDDDDDDDGRAHSDRMSSISRRSSLSVNSRESSPPERTRRRHGISNGHHGDYYRPERDTRKNRERSASPDAENGHPRTRRRTLSNHRRGNNPSRTSANEGKELFPVPSGKSAEFRSHKKLFPSKTTASGPKKELFPNGSGVSIHRRSGAFDAADGTMDLPISGTAASFGDATVLASSSKLGKSRTPTGPSVSASTNNDLIIRGASQQPGTGFSIRGAANPSHDGIVKELFPTKAGNSGKELFAEKLQGRGGRRNRAEDMFS